MCAKKLVFIQDKFNYFKVCVLVYKCLGEILDMYRLSSYPRNITLHITQAVLTSFKRNRHAGIKPEYSLQ
jgi:hypothetical protein